MSKPRARRALSCRTDMAGIINSSLPARVGTAPIEKTGSFRGRSNKLGYGGRSAQLHARGVPEGVIGELARKAGAAPGGPNYHGGKKGK